MSLGIRFLAKTNQFRSRILVANIHFSSPTLMFIQTEATPNPEAIKFIPGRGVLTALSDDKQSSAASSELPSESPQQEIYITKSKVSERSEAK